MSEWYYADSGSQAGTMSKAALDREVSAGELPADTLVRREGMGNRQPHTQVRIAGLQTDFRPATP